MAKKKSADSSAELARLLQAKAATGPLSIADLRHNSAAILSRVAIGGERIVITRNRTPVAALVPFADYETLKKPNKK